MNTKRVVLGAVAGAVAGATLSILYSSKTGTEVRNKISTKAEQIKDELSHRAGKFTGQVQENIHKAKQDAESLIDKGKSVYNVMKKNVKT